MIEIILLIMLCIPKYRKRAKLLIKKHHQHIKEYFKKLKKLLKKRI